MWIKQTLSTHPISTRDTVITCLVNTATCLLAGTVTFSILGHMAHNQGVDVASVSIIFLVVLAHILGFHSEPFGVLKHC